MAPLSDRSANRQSRIPAAAIANHGNMNGRNNNENSPPQLRISGLLTPTKSSMACPKMSSPTQVPAQVTPRAIRSSETPFEGHVHVARSNGNMSARISRHSVVPRLPPSTSMDVLNARKIESPNVPVQNTVKANNKQQEKLKMDNKPLPSRPLASSSYVSRSNKENSRPVHNSPGSNDFQQHGWAVSSPKRLSTLSTASSAKRMSSSRLPRAPDTHSTTKALSTNVFEQSTKMTSPRSTSPHPDRGSIDQVGMELYVAHADSPPRSSSSGPQEDKSAKIGLGVSTDNSSTDSVDHLAHKHMPPSSSFSQPRLVKSNLNRPFSLIPTVVTLTPQKPAHANINNVASTSRIPIKSPKLAQDKPDGPISTPDRPIAATAQGSDVLTFAGRSLGTESDFAALDQGISASVKRRPSTEKGSPLMQPSPSRKPKLTLTNLPPRFPSEPGKLSPMKYFFGDKSSPVGCLPGQDVNEYSRVRHISGTLLSTSFAGSTLSIADEADHLILGPPDAESSPTRSSCVSQELDLPSPNSNAVYVSWPATFGFNTNPGSTSPTVQSSPSIRNETRMSHAPRIAEEDESQRTSTIDLELSLSVASQDESDAPVNKSVRAPVGALLAAAANDALNEFLPGATITAEDGNSQVTATLSILEGTPVKPVCDEDYFSLSKTAGRQMSKYKGSEEGGDWVASKQKVIQSEPAGKSATRPSTGVNLAKPIVAPSNSGASPVGPRPGLVPSYMRSTPASEARQLPALPKPDIRRASNVRGLPSNADDFRASRIGRLTPTPTSDIRSATPPNRVDSTPEARRTLPAGRATPNSESRRTPQANKISPSSDCRIASSGGRLNATPRSGKHVPLRTVASSTQESTPAASGRDQASATPTKSPRHITLAQAAADQPSKVPKARTITPDPAADRHPPRSIFKSKHARGESKTRFALRNIKGLFSSKRDGTEVSSTPSLRSRRPLSFHHRASSVEPDVPPLPDSRGTTAAKSFASQKDMDVVHDEDFPSTTPEDEKRQRILLMEMGLGLRQEASRETDLARKERMASVAQMILDTVTNAVEAERNMYAAMQAAEQAKLSYEMTQHSVQEMSRLISNSRRLSNLFKRGKSAATAGLR